jgi:glycosyltransferase involved in cell wall biosynthesis
MVALRGGRMQKDFEKVCKVYIIGKRWKFDIFFLMRLIKVIKLEKPDIVHTFMFTSNFWGRLAALINRVPIIISSERSMDLWKKFFHIQIDRFFAKYSQNIVCNSNEVKERYKKVLDKYSAKLSVIYNGIDMPFFEKVEYKEKIKEEFGIKDEIIVLTGGRLCAEKGLDYFLQAASMVVKEFDKVKFLIVGEGEKREELLELANKLKLNKFVIFTGYRNDLSDVMKVSDIVVLSSLWEGLPNLLIEGMALKKAVIGTGVGGTVEIVKDKVSGLIIPAKNSEEHATSILSLLKDNKRRKLMGESGYNFVKENLSL